MILSSIAIACFSLIAGIGLGVELTVRHYRKHERIRNELIKRIRESGKLLDRRVQIRHGATVEQLTTKLEKLNTELLKRNRVQLKPDTDQEATDGTGDEINGDPDG